MGYRHIWRQNTFVCQRPALTKIMSGPPAPSDGVDRQIPRWQDQESSPAQLPRRNFHHYSSIAPSLRTRLLSRSYNKFHWPFIHSVDSLATCVTKLPHSASPTRAENWLHGIQHVSGHLSTECSILEHQAPYTAPFQVSSARWLNCCAMALIHFISLHFSGIPFPILYPDCQVNDSDSTSLLYPLSLFGHWGLFLLPKDNGIGSSCSNSMLICKMLNFPHKFDLS